VKATSSIMTDDKVFDRFDEKQRVVAFYYPVIVVDGLIREAYLDSNNEVVIEQPPWIPVAFTLRTPQYEQQRFTVTVVEKTAFSGFLDRLELTLGAWETLLDTRPELLKPGPKTR